MFVLFIGGYLFLSGVGELYFLDVCKSRASCPIGPTIMPVEMITVQMDALAFAIFGGAISLVGVVLVMAGLGHERWAVPTID